MISGLNLNTGIRANSSLKNSSRAAVLTRNIIIGHVSLLVFGVYARDDAVYVIQRDVVLVALAHHLYDRVLVLVVDHGQVDVCLRALRLAWLEENREHGRLPDVHHHGGRVRALQRLCE